MSLQASGNADPGRLDRRVVLQYAVSSRDDAGAANPTWEDAATVWAALQYLRGGRFYSAEEKLYEGLCSYRIRHRDDVATGWRLIHGDDVFEIISVEQIGRRHFLDLTCRALNQTLGDNRDLLDLGDGITLLDEGDDATTITLGGAIAA